MNKNKKIFNSIQKSNYHNERRNNWHSISNNQRRYSYAFIHGDSLAANGFKIGDEHLLKSSRAYKTLYEKKAFWRGAKNGNKRLDAGLSN